MDTWLADRFKQLECLDCICKHMEEDLKWSLEEREKIPKEARRSAATTIANEQ